MKPRFRFKELLLLLPVLGFMGGAFYWRRVEKVSDPNGSEMFVEKVEVKTASGTKREGGDSHDLVVTIDHPWPKPRFWNTCCNIHGGLTSLKKPIRIEGHIPGDKPENYISSLGEVIWTHDGKNEVLKQNWGKLSIGSARLQDGKYVFTHSLALQKANSQGEITFHGAYVIAGRPALEIRRVIRKSGQELLFDESRDTGERLCLSLPRHGKLFRLPRQLPTPLLKRRNRIWRMWFFTCDAIKCQLMACGLKPSSTLSNWWMVRGGCMPAERVDFQRGGRLAPCPTKICR